MDISGHSAEKYITGRMLRTSADRQWSGILAETWSHVAGELAPIVPRDLALPRWNSGGVYAIGFSSQSNFTRAFKKVAGTTPSRYRARGR